MSTQYFVRTLSRECLAKKVLVKPVRSWIGRFAASAHQEVNSNELEVFLPRLAPVASFTCWNRVVLE